MELTVMQRSVPNLRAMLLRTRRVKEEEEKGRRELY